MGIIIGQLQYRNFLKGERLSHKGAIFAHCYQCNGENEGGVDCQAKKCPLYPYFPYGTHEGVPKSTKSEKRSCRT